VAPLLFDLLVGIHCTVCNAQHITAESHHAAGCKWHCDTVSCEQQVAEPDWTGST